MRFAGCIDVIAFLKSIPRFRGAGVNVT